MRSSGAVTYFSWNCSETWSPLIAAGTGQRLTRKRLIRILTDEYAGVVAYHGRRPLNIDSYRTNGLLRSDSNKLDARAREIFNPETYPELKSERIEQAIAALGPRDDGKIYACPDYVFYTSYCTHYALYGSERLIAIAAKLSDAGSRDYRQELKRHGIPTVLHIGLPWWCIDESTMDEFAAHLVENMRKLRAMKPLLEVDFGFEFYDSLPASSILKFEHPAQLPDPFENGWT